MQYVHIKLLNYVVTILDIYWTNHSSALTWTTEFVAHVISINTNPCAVKGNTFSGFWFPVDCDPVTFSVCVLLSCAGCLHNFSKFLTSSYTICSMGHRPTSYVEKFVTRSIPKMRNCSWVCAQGFWHGLPRVSNSCKMPLLTHSTI